MGVAYDPDTKFVVVSQTISRRWLVPKDKTPRAFLTEVLEFGFDEEPAHEEILGEEYYLMGNDGSFDPLTPDDEEDDEE